MRASKAGELYQVAAAGQRIVVFAAKCRMCGVDVFTIVDSSTPLGILLGMKTCPACLSEKGETCES